MEDFKQNMNFVEKNKTSALAKSFNYGLYLQFSEQKCE